MKLEELTPTHPKRIEWAAETLACLVLQTADRREAKGNYDPKGGAFGEGGYKVNLVDISNENVLSFPVYLLLQYTWNDALDWADDPTSYVGDLKPQVIADRAKDT